MPKPAALTGPEAARQTLAHRLTRVADNLRQLNTRFGLRSKRVFLVWSSWSGDERGEGRENLLEEIELLPTPKVSDLSAVALRPYSAGIFPEGTIRITQISCGAYTEDHLRGLAIPMQTTRAPRADQGADVNTTTGEPTSNPRVDFWWSIREDGRGDTPPTRQRYRLYGNPNRKEGSLYWDVSLQRADEPFDRDGNSQIGVDRSEFPLAGLPKALP